MNLKKINILFLFLGLLVFAPKSVSAKLEVNVSNGGSNREPAKGPGTTSACNGVFSSGNQLCRFQLVSGDPIGVRVSLMYCDGTTCHQTGKTMDMWSKEPYGTKGLQSAGQSKVNSGALYYSDFQGGNYEYIVDPELKGKEGNELGKYLTSQFLDQRVQEEMAKKLAGEDLESMKKYFTNGHQEADPTGKNPANVGFRFMAEDVRGYLGSDGKYYVMTPTEYERLRLGGAKLQKLPGTEVTLWTNFDDVGIKTGEGHCYGNAGTFVDSSSFLDSKNGCGQYIIDFKEEVLEEILKITLDPNTECDWDVLAQKKLGDDLTPEEEACCEQLRGEIKDIVDIEMDTTYCMAVSETVPEYVTCMQNYFIKWQLFSGLLDNQQQKYKELYEKYPVCGCDYDKVEKIEEEYQKCREDMVISNWMAAWFQGKQTKCEIDRTSAISKFYAYNSPEICPQDVLFPNLNPNPQSCQIINGVYYGINGTKVTKTQYDKECDENPSGNECQIINGVYYGKNGTKVTKAQYDEECSSTNPCDENDPNSFPIPGTPNENNYECCYYFENQMKAKYEEEAISKGLRDTELKNYVKTETERWFNEKDFRKYCLNGCDINDSKLSEECCEELMELYKNDPYKDDDYWIGKGCKTKSGCDINDPILTEECCDELMNWYKDDPEKSDHYWEGKGCLKCKWTDYSSVVISGLNSMKQKECEVGNTTKVTVSDTKNEDCVFISDELSSLGKTTTVFRDYYVKFNNPYCAVYCMEDAEYEFPKGELVVKAGYHFTVGAESKGHAPNWSPIHFESTRTCKIRRSTNEGLYYRDDKEDREINQGKFDLDWYYANRDVFKAWDAWMIQLDYDWVYAGEIIQVGVCKETRIGLDGVEREYEIPRYGTIRQTSYTKYDGGTVVIAPTWCGNESRPSGPGGTASEFHGAIVHLETVEDDILACTDWHHFYQYRHTNPKQTDIKEKRYAKYDSYDEFLEYNEFNPDVTIDYVEPTYDKYNYNELLDRKVTHDNDEKNNFSIYNGASQEGKFWCNNGTNEPGEAPDLYACTGEDHFDYSDQKNASATYNKKIDYKIRDGVFNIILKPQGKAVNSGSIQNSEQIKIDLGYSALHVHFMTPSGIYGRGQNEDGKLDLLFPSFTPSDIENKYEHNFDHLEFKDEISFEDNYFYDCNYKVENEIIENEDPNCVGDNCLECTGENCEELTLKGLNLIFRPISLVNPFPGALGNGRNPGSNWDGAGLIENYITNNRGVSDYRIYYDKAPMYQITLTPALIQQIRKYNDTTTYNDFNMDCLTIGKECKSNYLRNQLLNHLSTCEFSGNKGTEKCCGIGSWNECDDRDGIEKRE